jgi:hypothetical protein
MAKHNDESDPISVEDFMLSTEGYKLVHALGRDRCMTFIFLMANFDLTKYTAMTPQKMIENGLHDNYVFPRSEKALTEFLDDMVKGNVLEYGPFIKFKDKKVPTVRICPRILLDAKDISIIQRQSREREERAELLPA